MGLVLALLVDLEMLLCYASVSPSAKGKDPWRPGETTSGKALGLPRKYIRCGAGWDPSAVMRRPVPATGLKLGHISLLSGKTVDAFLWPQKGFLASKTPRFLVELSGH